MRLYSMLLLILSAKSSYNWDAVVNPCIKANYCEKNDLINKIKLYEQGNR